MIVITVCTKYDIMSTKLNVDNDNDKIQEIPGAEKVSDLFSLGNPLPKTLKKTWKNNFKSIIK